MLVKKSYIEDVYIFGVKASVKLIDISRGWALEQARGKHANTSECIFCME